MTRRDTKRRDLLMAVTDQLDPPARRQIADRAYAIQSKARRHAWSLSVEANANEIVALVMAPLPAWQGIIDQQAKAIKKLERHVGMLKKRQQKQSA